MSDLVEAKRAPSAESRERLSALIRGYRMSQAVYVAARLGIADLLRDGPQSLFEKYQAASRLSIKRVIATYTNVSLVLGNSS